MTQYKIEGNSLILSVKKAPVAVTATLFVLAFLFCVTPAIAVVGAVYSGRPFQLQFLIYIGVFAIAGFYMLRLALWNTFGCEKLVFTANTVSYAANYGWFRDGKRTIVYEKIGFSMAQAGYEEDNKAVLVLTTDDSSITCAVAVPVNQLAELLPKLNSITMS